jgi:ectoine hydroxylase-related dioxygenase (phytanoyl-CoA dioxygenase family)
MPGANTPFTPLWTDRYDAADILAKKAAAGEVSPLLAERLEHLIEFGFVIIPGAIDHSLADQLLEEIANVTAQPDKFIARRARAAYAHPSKEVAQDKTFRIIDFHVNSRHAGKAIYCAAIAEVLDAVFQCPANAFQCLTFNYGSQQVLHQDGAYVVVSEPLQFLASWIALEDVVEGSGELLYYPGSHQLDDFMFGDNDSKAWEPAIHGKEIHRAFLDSLIERSEAAGLTRQAFLPKKGDALIWASDLVHGGAKIEHDRTRKSIVSHYCPTGVKPKFSTFTSYFHLRQVAEQGYISSRHYDLRGGKGWFRKSYPMLSPKFMGAKASD